MRPGVIGIALFVLAGCGGSGGSAKAHAGATAQATEYFASGAVAARGEVQADAAGIALLPAVKSGIWTFYYDAGAAGATGAVRERAAYVNGLHDDDRHDYVLYNRDGSIRDRYADGIGQRGSDGAIMRAGAPSGDIIPE